jgi:hypothetical protein
VVASSLSTWKARRDKIGCILLEQTSCITSVMHSFESHETSMPAFLSNPPCRSSDAAYLTAAHRPASHTFKRSHPDVSTQRHHPVSYCRTSRSNLQLKLTDVTVVKSASLPVSQLPVSHSALFNLNLRCQHTNYTNFLQRQSSTPLLPKMATSAASATMGVKVPKSLPPLLSLEACHSGNSY